MEVLETRHSQSISVLTGLHLVSRHWHQRAGRAATVLQPSVPRVLDDVGPMSKVPEACASTFPTVKELILHEHLRVQDSHLKLSDGFCNLVSLNLLDSRLIYGEGAVLLGRLTHLTKLSLGGVTSVGPTLVSTRCLMDVAGLTDLSLRGWRMCDVCFKCLGALTTFISMDMLGLPLRTQSRCWGKIFDKSLCLSLYLMPSSK
ncbi:unnamed protein product [Ostreobium quekettii]|uniref:Uncharacterized protein n=1 Tax=Ostreobium quekettii TaxID=121088 RepID=A0A8S1JF34_9CHLO|nr:unnamed protein product [Ostreobium quekettii]